MFHILDIYLTIEQPIERNIEVFDDNEYYASILKAQKTPLKPIGIDFRAKVKLTKFKTKQIFVLTEMFLAQVKFSCCRFENKFLKHHEIIEYYTLMKISKELCLIANNI